MSKMLALMAVFALLVVAVHAQGDVVLSLSTRTVEPGSSVTSTVAIPADGRDLGEVRFNPRWPRFGTWTEDGSYRANWRAPDNLCSSEHLDSFDRIWVAVVSECLWKDVCDTFTRRDRAFVTVGCDDDSEETDESLPTLEIANAAVDEGGGARFVVTLSEVSEDVVTVWYAAEDVTAVEGADYTAMEGTLRFRPGDRRETLRVPTVEDKTAEGTETFRMQLSNPSGATLADRRAVGTIHDDDGG